MHPVRVANRSLSASDMAEGGAKQPAVSVKNSRPLSSLVGERGLLFRHDYLQGVSAQSLQKSFWH